MFKKFLLKLNIIYVIIGLFLQSTYGYELKLVKQSEKEENLKVCLRGYTPNLCNYKKLSDYELKLVKQSEKEENLKVCLRGYTPNLCNYKKLSDYELKLVKQSENNYSKNYLCAENGSCYGDKSLKTGKPKNTHVKGYFRKDGTYVRGHYRSR